MILSAEERAAIAAQLSDEPAWQQIRSKIEARVKMPRQRGRLIAEALEKHAFARGLLDEDQMRRVLDPQAGRPIEYPASGVI